VSREPKSIRDSCDDRHGLVIITYYTMYRMRTMEGLGSLHNLIWAT
jgi:hypothetical protein